MTKRVEVSGGVIEYTEVGTGRPLVFVHGILAGPELWHPLAERLANQFRCITPTWPLGTHDKPMAKDANVSPAGLATLIAEFLDVLDLDDVVLVGNDSGGALCQLVAADHNERVGSMVLTNCDALEVFPPPMFAYLRWFAFVPGAYAVLSKLVHWMPFAQRMSIAYGGLSRDPHPELWAAWSKNLATNAGARRDVVRFARGAKKQVTLEVAERLANFTKPTLLLWGQDDRFFSTELAERLAAKLPEAHLEPIADACTFVSLDQPAECAKHIADFLSAKASVDLVS